MVHFFIKLRRRRVVKVAAVYAAVAWLLVQVAVAIETPLRMPQWVDTVVIILLGLGFPVAIVLVIVFKPAFHLNLVNFILFIPALLLAMAVRFSGEWALSMGAFWSTRTNALNEIYYFMLFFLSGQVAPSSLLPGFLQNLAWISPFRWMLAFPIEVAMGKVPNNEIISGFTMQIVWLIIFGVCINLLWKRGIKKYSAVGS